MMPLGEAMTLIIGFMAVFVALEAFYMSIILRMFMSFRTEMRNELRKLRESFELHIQNGHSGNQTKPRPTANEFPTDKVLPAK